MALILILVIGITYLIRISSPVGDWMDLPLLGFQPAHITQYILCFSLGIAAYRWNILETITDAVWKKSLVAGQILIIVVFPAIFLLSGKADKPELFMGGGSVYSFLLAFWDQLVAFTMIIGITGLFKKHFNSQNNLLKDLSRSSYAIYVFHGVVLVGIFLLFQSYNINSLQKFIILLLPNLVFCYLLAKLILKIPIVQKVL
jgi:surface polysaccharide O-acyltransferase-like enzyme